IGASKSSLGFGVAPSALGSGRRLIVEADVPILSSIGVNSVKQGHVDAKGLGSYKGKNSGSYVNYESNSGNYDGLTTIYDGSMAAMLHPTMMYARESSVVVENVVNMLGIGKRRKDAIPDDIVHEVKQDELMKNRSKEDHAKLTGIAFGPSYQEQEKSEETHINYQCRYSFLEVYNKQVGDLLDPIRRNLQGLSNRKVGASSINSKSSQSHIIFTCVIESWCKVYHSSVKLYFCSTFTSKFWNTAETSSQAYDSATNDVVVHLGSDDVSRMTNGLTDSKFISNPRDALRNFREASPQADDQFQMKATYNASRYINGQTCSEFHTKAQLSTLTSPRETSTQEDYHVSNGGPMHFGVDDVSRTINRQTGTAFQTYSRSTLAIPREMGTQKEYCVSNGGDIHFGINVVSTTINRQTESGFRVNPHSTLAIPMETSTQGNYQLSNRGFRFINAQTCSALHTNPRSTVTIPIPRKTSTKENCHASNGNSMHHGISDVSRIINGQTGSGVHSNSHIALVIPWETNTQADDGGVMHLAVDNFFRTIDEITGFRVHTNPLSKFTNPRDTSTQAHDSISNRGVAQLDTNDAYMAANAKTGIESDSQTSATPHLAREIFNVLIKCEYAQSNSVADNELPMMLTSINLLGLLESMQ
ncbi:hypothetical protein GIB67_006280, partial [Kingdonia uniflora]